MNFEQEFLAFSVDVENPLSGVAKIFRHCRPDLFQSGDEKPVIKVLMGGLSNRMFLVSTTSQPDDKTLVRIYTSVMKNLFDRNEEYEYTKFLSKFGLYGQIYGRFSNGICFAYREGRVVTLEEFRDEKISRLIAEKLAEMHAVSLSLPNRKRATLIDRAAIFMSNAPWNFVDCAAAKQVQELFPDIISLKQEFESWISHCKDFLDDSPLVLCHNDLLPNNLIIDERVSASVHLIDFEFANIGYQADDIGDHFTEFVGLNPEKMDFSDYPSESFQLRFIRNYLEAWIQFTSNKSPVTDDDVWNLYVRSNKFALVKLWFFFGVVLTYEAQNQDYIRQARRLEWESLRYARKTIDGYFQLKKIILPLQLHNVKS